ncbi:MAG: Crp/Fnr family transcriptional regulator [Polyangiaceae bacterium]|jgi:CRP-like cAMP-binding protein
MADKRVADYRELLRSGRWFRGLAPPFQDALVAMAHLRPVHPRNVLFARGQASNGVFAVLEGQLRACGIDDDGKQALLTIVEPPSWVGEIPLFDGLPRTHDLIADTEGLVVQVPQEPLLAFLDREPRYWRELALLLTAKLRLAFVSMESAQLLPLAARVAHRLVLIAEGYGEWSDRSAREIGVSQQTLAAMLSTSRQTVNQALRGLEARGFVRLQYGRVEIVDLEGLRRTLRRPHAPRKAP